MRRELRRSRGAVERRLPYTFNQGKKELTENLVDLEVGVVVGVEVGGLDYALRRAVRRGLDLHQVAEAGGKVTLTQCSRSHIW